MAALRLVRAGYTRSKVCSLPTVFRAHDPIVASILVIQTRPKMSKTSPFPKRSNPMKKQREDVSKSVPGISKMNKERPMDRPMFIDSPGMIFSDYLPIRRFFILTPSGIKERWNAFKNGLWTIYSLVHVRKHCKPFKLKEFAKQAQEIYIDVNKSLSKCVKRLLFKYNR